MSTNLININTFINTRTFILNKENLSGIMDVKSLERLAEIIDPNSNDNQQLHFNLIGNVDSKQHWLLDIKITGQLHLICTRCLESMVYEIECENSILVAKNQSELELLDESEELEVILTQKELKVLELLEEELLLSLPISPKHDDCESFKLPEESELL